MLGFTLGTCCCIDAVYHGLHLSPRELPILILIQAAEQRGSNIVKVWSGLASCSSGIAAFAGLSWTWPLFDWRPLGADGFGQFLLHLFIKQGPQGLRIRI